MGKGPFAVAIRVQSGCSPGLELCHHSQGSMHAATLQKQVGTRRNAVRRHAAIEPHAMRTRSVKHVFIEDVHTAMGQAVPGCIEVYRERENQKKTAADGGKGKGTTKNRKLLEEKGRDNARRLAREEKQ